MSDFDVDVVDVDVVDVDVLIYVLYLDKSNENSSIFYEK